MIFRTVVDRSNDSEYIDNSFKKLFIKSMQSETASVFSIISEESYGRLESVLGLIPNGIIVNEVDSSELFIDKILDKAKIKKILRATSSLIIKENMKIVTGEVVSMNSDKIGLKTKDMESIFEIGAKMKDEIVKERISVGDIIKIYKDHGFICKLDSKSPEGSFKNNAQYPEGECIRNEIVTTTVTLDELDTINSKEGGEKLLFSNLKIHENVQNEVDKKIFKWIKEATATLRLGVLIIDNADLLSEKDFEYIVKSTETSFCPLIICLFNYKPNFPNKGEFRYILPSNEPKFELSKFAQYNSFKIDNDAIETLAEICKDHGISKAITVLKASLVGDTVTNESVSRIISLFTF